MAIDNSMENPLPLREISKRTYDWITRLGNVWAMGQLIEIKRRPNGFQYLTMRDLESEVSVRCYCNAMVLEQNGPIKEGAEVTACLKPNYWQKTGSLMFELLQIKPSGEGQLLAQIEALKNKLRAEGLFAQELKKPLPFLPNRIGLITGRDSAAERDVIENVRRRWPQAKFEIAYSLVQGPTAAAEVIEKLQLLDDNPAVDVIIIARGGGSLEDLLPFSDEALARAVAAAKTPVISAIGHEPDCPVMDFVADLRASTPTDAAKRVVPDVLEEKRNLQATVAQLQQLISYRLEMASQNLAELRNRPVLHDPISTIAPHQEQLTTQKQRMLLAVSSAQLREQDFISQTFTRIRALSPRATLQRGYAILADENRQSVTSVTEVTPKQKLNAILLDGILDLEVISKEEK